MKWIFIALVGEDMIDTNLNGIHCWALVVLLKSYWIP